MLNRKAALRREHLVRWQGQQTLQSVSIWHLQTGHCDILIHRHLPPEAAALNPHDFAALQLAYNHFSANEEPSPDHHARGHRYTCFGQSADLTQMPVYWLVLLEPLQKSGRWARPQRLSVGQKAALGSVAITVHRAT